MQANSPRSGGDTERKIYIKLIDWENETKDNALLSCRQEELCNFIASSGRMDNYNDEKVQIVKTGKNVEQNSPSSAKENANTFLKWSDDFLKSVDNRDNKLTWYCDQLKLCRYYCDAMHRLLTSSNWTLCKLRSKWEYTSEKTISLNESSKRIVKNQTDLTQLNAEIRHNACYYSQIDQLTCRLQSTGQIPVFGKVDEYLTSIDESLVFIHNNKNFKDAAIYIARYKHLLSKVINIIRGYVSYVIKNAAQESLMSSKENNSDHDSAFALYYGKFHNCAAKIKRISNLVEDRVTRDTDYEDLLSDLHKVYLTERANVLIPAIQKSIAELKSNNKGDYCVLTRSACGLLAHVCQDEHRLFYLFFSVRSAQLFSYLEGLCSILYDSLRPYLIHVNHLETLAEICGIIKIEMIEENLQSDGALEPFVIVMRQLLQDAQERLVFRTHIYINSDILNYNPSPGDLAYPEKLRMMESIAANFSDSKNSSFQAKTANTSDENLIQSMDIRPILQTSNSPADLHGMWYPTVRRTLICLSRLYRCVDRHVFQGLSQEAIRSCVQSIDKAAVQITQKQSIIDGLLFQIKHLLILREQMAPFRTEFTMKETSLDFSKIKTAAFELLQKRKQFFSLSSNNALLEFLFEGAPQVKEYFMDSRKEVDKHLKLICEKFIKCAAYQFVGSLICFLDKVDVFLSDSSQTNKASDNTAVTKEKLSEKPWASANHVKDLICASTRALKNELSELQRSMKLYLSNRDTEFIIFRLIKNNVINAFIKLEIVVRNNGYTSEELTIIDCPSAEQISVLISSVSILSESVTIELT